MKQFPVFNLLNKYTLRTLFHTFIDLFKQSVPDDFSEYAELSMFTLGAVVLVTGCFQYAKRSTCFRDPSR